MTGLGKGDGCTGMHASSSASPSWLGGSFAVPTYSTIIVCICVSVYQFLFLSRFYAACMHEQGPIATSLRAS
eukprot:m.39839 g.39839  ORF g.39839 m.39839 type:complete len:72 (-) comp12704_c1_seq1:30-245(-)